MDLKPLNLADLNGSEKSLKQILINCPLCDLEFKLEESEQKPLLAHLLLEHNLVIGDVDKIGDLAKYLRYWRGRFSEEEVTLEDVCYKIHTNTGENDLGQTETYFMLCDELPEDRTLREQLNIHKLERALKQLEFERNDQNYIRECLFCPEQIGNNRKNLLDHMAKEHNFSIGKADNIVYFDDFYKMLSQRMENLQCLFCEKIFYDKRILKEHMRKKQHKCIDPNNKQFDRFYIINYLEYSKEWQDIKSEKDVDEAGFIDKRDSPCIEDWNDPVQTYFCLFCEESFETEEEILGHMLDAHKFDMKSTISQSNLSFYNQVKLLNYIRQQIYTKSCFVCKQQFDSKAELLPHLNQDNHINTFPPQEFWDQPEFYFSTFEDDSLLCLLDDNGYEKDEAKIQVIPESVDLKVNEEILKNLNELKL